MGDISKTRSLNNTGGFIIALIALLGALAVGLCACSSADSAESHVDSTAFGTSFEEAQAAVKERAEDATLLAVQCQTTATDDEPIWTYLFGSKEMSFMYSVAPETEKELAAGGGPYEAHTYGRLEWSDREWEAIPSPNEVAVNSFEALRVVDEVRNEPVDNYSMYLVMHLSGEGSEDASVTPLVWEVLVNTEAVNEEGKTEEMPGECYLVDAITGELSEKIASDSASNQEEANAQTAEPIEGEA